MIVRLYKKHLLTAVCKCFLLKYHDGALKKVNLRQSLLLQQKAPERFHYSKKGNSRKSGCSIVSVYGVQNKRQRTADSDPLISKKYSLFICNLVFILTKQYFYGNINE